MSIIAILIVGGIIGWLGASLVGRREGIIASIVIGIVGAFIGSSLEKLLVSSSHGYLVFSWPGVLWSLIGAILFSGFLNLFHRSSTHQNN